jgi:chemotaxis signal transduction protein
MNPSTQATAQAASPRSDYCIFLREGRRFALSTTIAKEVLEGRPFTPVPHAPAELLGAFNLRGEVVPLVNLDCFLEASGEPPVRGGTLLLLSHADVALAAVVDQVVVIRHISPWEIRRPKLDPSTANPLVRGLFGKDEEQTLVLDGERLVTGVAERIATGMRGRARTTTPPQATSGAPEGGAPLGAARDERGEAVRAGAGGARPGGR